MPHALDTNEPMSYGNLTAQNDYFKFRRAMHDAQKEANVECRSIEKEFAERFGRKYGPTEEYRTEDADTVIVGLGTMAREAEVAVDLLRKQGVKAGSIRVRQFRPFPKLNIGGKKVIVLDRDCSFGAGGILAQEIRFHHDVPVYNIIAGIGGQDVRYETIAELVKKAKPQGEFWLGVD
jgi:pyruvate ferredoxin oxidoreductase alpha subunit